MKNEIANQEQINLKDGFGIFNGPGMEIGKGCWYVVIIICFIVPISILIGIIDNPTLNWLYILLLASIVGTYFATKAILKNIRAPKKMSKDAKIDGFWFSEGKIWAGGLKIEFEKEININDLYKQEFVKLKPQMLPIVDNDLVFEETLASEIIFHLFNSQNNKYYWKIARVYLMSGNINTSMITLIGGMRPVMLCGDKIYMCDKLNLADQLKIIMDGITIAKWKNGIGKFLITPRGGISDAIVFQGLIGGMIKSFSDDFATSKVRKALANGEFVDKTISGLLLQFIETYGWSVKVKKFNAGEYKFGLAHTQW